MRLAHSWTASAEPKWPQCSVVTLPPGAFGSSDTQAQLQQETIGATKDRMLRELGDALKTLTSSTPVVLVLEDLHWADTPSIG